MRNGEKSQSTDFPKNLRLLCSYCTSVSDVCRRLGINRQQFARYLSGDSLPSDRNTRKICDFFGVEESEIFLPYREFSHLILVKAPEKPQTSNLLDSLNLFDNFDHDTLSVSRRYLGYYYRYLRSIEYPNTIIKACVFISEADGNIRMKAIERLRPYDQNPSFLHLYKYKGIFRIMSDRIFIIETDYLLKNAITETILYPTHKNPLTYLFGKAFGISSGPLRQPYMTPIVYEYQGAKPNLRKLLSGSGLYPEDTPTISPKIRDYLLHEAL